MLEDNIHKQICEYIKLQYPDFEFNTDMSGIKLTIGQAKKIKKLRSSRAFPDIVIYEPTTKYCGLFLEVKKETPFKINGDLKKCEHLKEQQIKMDKLIYKGYSCSFVWSLDMAINVINEYLDEI